MLGLGLHAEGDQVQGLPVIGYQLAIIGAWLDAWILPGYGCPGFRASCFRLAEDQVQGLPVIGCQLAIIDAWLD